MRRNNRSKRKKNPGGAPENVAKALRRRSRVKRQAAKSRSKEVGALPRRAAETVTLEGVFAATERGFGFVTVTEESPLTEDIFIPARKRGGAMAGMAAGTALMAVCGALVNYFILIPAYTVLMNLPMEAIVGMGQAVWSAIDSPLKLVIFITAPFNLLKGGVLSAVTTLLYKRVSPLLHPQA